MNLCVYAFMFISRVCVCVGGGGKHPGSTVSQAASCQAGLSHGPPGEGCLLWARAVMIVPAGGIAHAHFNTHRPAHMALTDLHVTMYVQTCV